MADRLAGRLGGRRGRPNGVRYAPSGVLVGGTGQRHFAGIHFKPHKLGENAATPTTMVSVHFQGSDARRRSRVAGVCWGTVWE